MVKRSGVTVVAPRTPAVERGEYLGDISGCDVIDPGITLLRAPHRTILALIIAALLFVLSLVRNHLGFVQLGVFSVAATFVLFNKFRVLSLPSKNSSNTLLRLRGYICTRFFLFAFLTGGVKLTRAPHRPLVDVERVDFLSFPAPRACLHIKRRHR